MGKLRILCVGTGRDGTQSVTHMIEHLFAAGDGGTTMHEYCCREFYDAFCNHAETGEQVFADNLTRMVADCPYDCIVGNGYASILPLFAARYGRQLRLIHLRRKDRESCVASLAKNCLLFPEAYGYYSSDSRAATKRMAAFHFGEMSSERWMRLPTAAKFHWYYDKTHSLVQQYRGLFDHTLEIETESLGTMETRRKLADFVMGPDAPPPPTIHLNASVIDIASYPEEFRHKMHWLMGRLDIDRIARDDTYAMRYFLDKYVAWTGYQIGHEPQLGPIPAPSETKIGADLDEALGAIIKAGNDLQSLKTRLGGGEKPPGDRHD